MPLLVPILFPQVVFPCSYLIGGTIPTSLLVLVKSIFTPHVSVLFMECQLHIMVTKSLFHRTHEPYVCKLSVQAYKHQCTCTNMAVSDRLHSHVYSMCLACLSQMQLIPIEMAQARTKENGHDPQKCQYLNQKSSSPFNVQYEVGNSAQLCQFSPKNRPLPNGAQ